MAREVPLGPVGLRADRRIVRRQLEAIFDDRRAQIPTLLSRRAS